MARNHLDTASDGVVMRTVITLIAGLLTLAGCGLPEQASPTSTTPALPPAVTSTGATATSAPTTPAPVEVVLPEVAGRNGQIVVDDLEDLGLTNVTLASRDAEDKFVVLPANWTAVKIEPGPGTTIMSDDTVVLTLTKQG